MLTVPDLVVVDVTKSFGRATAVERVSLEIQKGEFVSIIGPSGCGKTTLLRMIAGLTPPSSGRIVIRGEDVSNKPVYDRNIGFVFQDLALFPHMNVGQNVEFGLKVRKVDPQKRQERVRETLALVALEGFENRKISTLSGGQQQRVALARALVTNPSILLLDEPFTGLDAHLRVRMQSELKQLQQRLAMTFIFVTHDQGEALAMSDRVVVMNQGRIEQVGSPLEVYREPKTRFVASFVGENNLFEGRVVSSDGDVVHVQTSLGVFPARSSMPVGRGTLVTYVLPASSIKIADGGSGPSDGGLRGVIKGVSFSGGRVTCHVEIGSTVVRVVEHLNEAWSPRQFGEDVTLSWESSRAFLLPAS